MVPDRAYESPPPAHRRGALRFQAPSYVSQLAPSCTLYSMPALPNVPGVLKLNIHWGVEADTRAQTVHHLSYTGGPPSAAQCATMAASAVSTGATNMQTAVGLHSGMTNCEVTDLTSSTSGQGTGGSGWAGTRTGGQLAPGTAALANYTISRRYRGGKPRSYLPFGTATDVDVTGLWLAASTTAFHTALANWFAALIGIGAGCTIQNVVNVSYYHGSNVVISPTTGRAKNVPILRGTPLVDIISASSFPTRIGSQRRRNKDA